MTISVQCTSPIFDVKFHKRHNLIALSGVDGTVKICQYDPLSPSFVTGSEICIKTSSSARTIDFNNSNYIAIGNRGGDVRVTEIQSGCDRFNLASSMIGITKVKWMTENVLASGSEDGVIQIWDKRVESPLIATISECNEQIMDLCSTNENGYLLATSSDKLAVFDMRNPKSKLHAMSDEMEDDLLCLGLFKNESRIICGTNDGPLAVFHFGDFGDMKERITGTCLESSTNCLDKLSEDLLLVGNDDGRVGVVTLEPNMLCGVLCVQEMKNTPNAHLGGADDTSTSDDEGDSEDDDDDSSESDNDEMQDQAIGQGALGIDCLCIDKDCSVVATASVIDQFCRIYPVAEAFKMQSTALETRECDVQATTSRFFDDI